MKGNLFFGVLLWGAIFTSDPTWSQVVMVVPLEKPSELKPIVLPPDAADREQIARYKREMENLREREPGFNIQYSGISADLRANRSKAIIKARKPAQFSQDVVLSHQEDVTTKSKMNYGFVFPRSEPSSAAFEMKVLVTFNKGAAFSDDGAKTFHRVVPDSIFSKLKARAGGRFCCDQVVTHIKSHNIFVWALQNEDEDNGNVIRLLIANDAALSKNNFTWSAHDFSSETLLGRRNQRLDFPDIAFTERFLFILVNIFHRDDYLRSVIWRMSLTDLAQNKPLNAQVYAFNGSNSARLTQGATNRMFWASHRTNNSLNIQSWADLDTQPAQEIRVPVQPHADLNNETIRNVSIERSSVMVDGKLRPWLARLDSRITAAWYAKGLVGFAWTSGAVGKKSGSEYSMPHIRIALIDPADLDPNNDAVRPVSEPHIWSNKHSFAYPSAAPNANGDVALVFYFSNRSTPPSAAVALLLKEADDWQPRLTVILSGKQAPRCLQVSAPPDNGCGEWGDYINLRASSTDPTSWYVALATEQDTGRNELPKISISYVAFSIRSRRGQ